MLLYFSDVCLTPEGYEVSQYVVSIEFLSLIQHRSYACLCLCRFIEGLGNDHADKLFCSTARV